MKQYFSWIVAGDFRAGFDLQMDQLTVVMVLVVIGLVVTVLVVIGLVMTGLLTSRGGG